MSRTTPSRRAATARSSSSPMPWPSVSLIDLKLSTSTNSAATGVWLRRERTSICSTRSRISVRLGRPVSASWVARNASSSWRRVSSSWERWRSDSKDWHIRTSVTSRLRCSMPKRPGEHVSWDVELRGRLTQHVVGRVAPAQAALGDLVQRRLALGGQMAEDPPGLLPDLARHGRALAGHPARDGERGDGPRRARSCLRRRRRGWGPSSRSGDGSPRPRPRCARSAPRRGGAAARDRPSPAPAPAAPCPSGRREPLPNP